MKREEGSRLSSEEEKSLEEVKRRRMTMSFFREMDVKQEEEAERLLHEGGEERSKRW